MAVFKCKMCGGALEINNETIAVCEYCGTTQTLPKLDDERKASLYDRANHLRRNNEFDKAMGLYEQILSEDQTDAETYWSLVLCRYGIEYVEDPATRKRIPTVNRAQMTSIFSDADYKSALKYADAQQKAIYEAEATAIDNIQKEILSIAQNEEPFDVFICYKETDANGRRTPDSVYAQDIYKALIEEGLKVFFARITLEDKLGSAYEPYIFSALQSAKVMLVVGTKAEYLNAVWVKNEWSRFLALIRGGAKKTLIPCYRDMDAYDLPEEFAHLQAQDMAKLGFIQDLTRGVTKITNQNQTQKNIPVVQEYVDASAMLKRSMMQLENGNWKEADAFAEKVLNVNPENADAYLYKLFAEMKVSSIESLEQVDSVFDKNQNYLSVLRFGNEDLKEKLSACAQKVREANLVEIYDRARLLYESDSEENVKKSMELFASIAGYQLADSKLASCETRLKEIRDQIDKKKATKKGLLIAGISSVVIAIIITTLCLLETYVWQPARIYDNAGGYFASEAYQQAKELYDSLGDYKDSKDLAQECEYLKHVKWLEEGSAMSAYEYFKNSDYKDSKTLAKEAQYQYAKANLQNTDETTYSFLSELKAAGYKDSAQIYEDLYSWKIKLRAFNTSSDDFNTILESLPRSADYLHFSFELTGGTPGETVTLYHKYAWPNQNQLTSDWDWENKDNFSRPGCEWPEGYTVRSSGYLAIEVYNRKTNVMIGRFSIKVD